MKILLDLAFCWCGKNFQLFRANVLPLPSLYTLSSPIIRRLLWGKRWLASFFRVWNEIFSCLWFHSGDSRWSDDPNFLVQQVFRWHQKRRMFNRWCAEFLTNVLSSILSNICTVHLSINVKFLNRTCSYWNHDSKLVWNVGQYVLDHTV